MNEIKGKKIAIVYDWLDTNFGGAEIIIKSLLKLYPQACLFTAFVDKKKCHWVDKYLVRTSFLQRFPLIYKRKSLVGVFLPLAFESLNFEQFDVIISISSFASKYILTKPTQKHFAYILTPPRFLFSHQDEYQLGVWRLFPFSWIYKKFLAYLRKVDLIAIHRADYLIAISKLIQKRIKKYYHQSSDIIYPPIDFETEKLINQFGQENNDKFDNRKLSFLTYWRRLNPFFNYYLMVGRLVFYKRVDLAIRAVVNLGKNLIIVGSSGSQEKKLWQLCLKLGLRKKNILFLNKQIKIFSNTKAQIFFLQNLTKEEILSLSFYAQAFLLVGLEDFGLATLEASLMGCQIILQSSSGVAELINHQQTHFFSLADLVSLEGAILNFEKSNSFITVAKKKILDPKNFNGQKFTQDWKKIIACN